LKVLKWTLELIETQTITLPARAKVLSIQMQRGELQLWALCDDGNDGPSEVCEIGLHYTGRELPDKPGHYLGTIQMEGGAIVIHAFERARRFASKARTPATHS
jgi:hypothetical protein